MLLCDLPVHSRVLLPVAVIALLGGGCGADPTPADLVLVNGTILTVDPSDTIAEAVAIRGSGIIAVGSNDEIKPLIGSGTRRIDLEGLTATPGLIDAHAHFASSGASRLFVADLSYPTVKSIADVAALVEKMSAEGRDWITGDGWDEGKLDERRYILASDLDPVSGDTPVWLTHTMGHYGAANSAALRLAGITKETPDPPGGTIDRTSDGTPTGVLKESAQRLVSRLVPKMTASQQRRGIVELAKAFNAEGMTGAKDPGISGSVEQAYLDVQEAGQLTVRIFALRRGGRSLEQTRQALEGLARTVPGSERSGDFAVGGIKLFADGSGGARTAWLYEDWNQALTGVDIGNRGYPAYDPAVLREQIRLVHNEGVHISTHAVGDRAIDWVVDSYWEALTRNPMRGLRHGIIHMNIPSEHALERTAEMQREYHAGYPEPSATFMWWIGDTYAGNFGVKRAARLNPFRTFVAKGIQWAGSSDYSVTPFAARYGIWASVARETALGVYGSTPWGMAQSVDVVTALKSFTIWAAHQLFLEERVGSIEPGKLADIAVWDRDPYSVETADLKDMTCVMTLFGGRVVYTAD